MRDGDVAAQHQGRFVVLDGMRGLAAIVVLLYHLGGAPSQLFGSGFLAVDFFFVLSGFVLAKAYGERPMRFSRFLRVRLVRLYPLYLAGTVLGVLAIALMNAEPDTYRALPFNLLFLPTAFETAPLIFGRGALFPFNGPAWSLFFELAVNIVWFALLPFLDNRRLAMVCAASALLLVGGLWACDALALPVYWSNLLNGLVRTPFSFFAGAAIYRLWRSGAFATKVPLWLAVGLLLVIFALPHGLILQLAVTLLLLPMLVLAGANIAAPARLVPACTLLGNMSYAVYAVHYPILALFNLSGDRLLALPAALGPLLATHPSLVITPLKIAVVLLVAYVLDRYFDQPLRAWLSRRN